MKPDDPNIRWVGEPQLGLGGKMYLPLFVQGLSTTFKHLSSSLKGRTVTVSYPDEEPETFSIVPRSCPAAMYSTAVPGPDFRFPRRNLRKSKVGSVSPGSQQRFRLLPSAPRPGDRSTRRRRDAPR